MHADTHTHAHTHRHPNTLYYAERCAAGFDSLAALLQGMESPMATGHFPLPTQSPVALPQAHTLEEIERQMLSRGRKPQVGAGTHFAVGGVEGGWSYESLKS